MARERSTAASHRQQTSPRSCWSAIATPSSPEEEEAKGRCTVTSASNLSGPSIALRRSARANCTTASLILNPNPLQTGQDLTFCRFGGVAPLETWLSLILLLQPPQCPDVREERRSRSRPPRRPASMTTRYGACGAVREERRGGGGGGGEREEVRGKKRDAGLRDCRIAARRAHGFPRFFRANFAWSCVQSMWRDRAAWLDGAKSFIGKRFARWTSARFDCTALIESLFFSLPPLQDTAAFKAKQRADQQAIKEMAARAKGKGVRVVLCRPFPPLRLALLLANPICDIPHSRSLVEASRRARARANRHKVALLCF